MKISTKKKKFCKQTRMKIQPTAKSIEIWILFFVFVSIRVSLKASLIPEKEKEKFTWILYSGFVLFGFVGNICVYAMIIVHGTQSFELIKIAAFVFCCCCCWNVPLWLFLHFVFWDKKKETTTFLFPLSLFLSLYLHY